jgi:hypothetical protein
MVFIGVFCLLLLEENETGGLGATYSEGKIDYVGDVDWLLEGVSGCYVTNWDKEIIASSIIQALNFSSLNKSTNGRKKLLELNLDSGSIAKRIIEVYKS